MMRVKSSIGYSGILILVMTSALLSCSRQENGSSPKDTITDVIVRVAQPVQSKDKVQKIPLDNCNGTSELERGLELGQFQRQTIEVGDKAVTTAGVEIDIPSAARVKLEGRVTSEYRQAYENASSLIDNFRMKAKPGSHVLYQINWDKIVYKSEVVFSYEQKSLRTSYEYTLSVPDYGGTERLPCPVGSSDLDPVAAVEIVPNAVTVAINDSHQLSVNLKDRDGNPLHNRKIRWSSSNDSIAAVSQNGIVTGRSVGEAAVKAESEGVVNSANISVQPPQIATVEVVPGNVVMQTGQLRRLAGLIKDRNGLTVKNRTVNWQSNAEDIVTLSDDGVIVGLSTGSATVSAIADGKKGTANITVSWGMNEIGTQELGTVLQVLPDQIKRPSVGVVLPLTGHLVANGNALRKKIETALGGYRAAYFDGGDRPDIAVVAMNKLVDQGCRIAIIGSYSFYKKAAENILKSRKLLAYIVAE
jgi:hypothetical protein